MASLSKPRTNYMVRGKDSVFVDANVFIALINQEDKLHQRALELRDQLKTEKVRLVTSNFIIAEVLTVLSMRVSKKKAIEFGELVYKKTKFLTVLRPTKGIEELAFDYFKKIKSKNVSFVDCLTLAIVKIFGVKRVFSFDRDLKQKEPKFELIF